MSFKSTILITGGTSGLGYQAATIIAKAQPESKVIIASRKDADGAAASINAETKHNNVEYIQLDLGSLSAVRDFASRYKAQGFPPIKALLLNAGLQFPVEQTFSSDNMEKTFAINHLGNAFVYHLLKSELTKDARVVLTASGVHDPATNTGMPAPIYVSAELLAHPPSPDKEKWDGGRAYTNSKLCNILWMYALDRRFRAEAGFRTVTSFDPGLMPGTGLAREASGVMKFFWHNIMPRIIPLLRILMGTTIRTQEESGKHLARLAVDEDVQGKSAVYFDGHEPRDPSLDARAEEKQEDLWNWTVKTLSSDETEMGIR